MGKLIAKTAFSTLLAVIGVLFILYGTLSFLFPNILQNFATRFHLTRTEAIYSLKVYQNKPNMTNLSIAVQKNYQVAFYETVAIYGNKFITDANFDAFCQDNFISGTKYTTKVYFQSITAQSFYAIGNKQQALEIAKQSYDKTANGLQVVDWLSSIPTIAEDGAFIEQLNAIKNSNVLLKWKQIYSYTNCLHKKGGMYV